MPFIVSQKDTATKVYAHQDADRDIRWVPSRARATRFTDDEASIFVAEFNKYSTTELEIEGAKEIAECAPAG